jgi:hypothetical protein
MSAPRYDGRVPIIDGTPSGAGWFIAAAAAIGVVFGVLFFSTIGDAPRTASSPRVETTGQTGRTAIPANPSGTAPQNEAPQGQ